MSKIIIGPEVKALIFDIDGTLVDTMPIHYEACQRVCNAHGFNFPLDLFYEKAGMPTEKVFTMLIDQLGLALDPLKLSEDKEKAYFELVVKAKPLQPIADIAIQYHNILPMALGTGSSKLVSAATIKASGMGKYFKVFVTADDVQNHKPHPDTFLLCAKQMGIAPESCLVFEDANPGIHAAIAAGMQYIDVREVL